MYKTQNGFTKQKIIDTIMQRNKGYCAVASSGCLYRTDDGNKCFAGCFIPDGLYSEVFEGKSIGTVMRDYPNVAGFMPLDAMGMDSLQAAHDGLSEALRVPEKGMFFAEVEKWVNARVVEA